QFSISVLDDDNKENLPTDTAPCFTIGIPDEYIVSASLSC
nr:pas-pac-pac sensing his kinase [Escherichia coli]